MSPMHRLVRSARFAAVLLGITATTATAQTSLSLPGARGDQLIFFYDATDERVSFLFVSNLGMETTLEVTWYPADLSTKLASDTVTLGENGNTVLDPTAIPAVVGQMGLAVVTPVRSADDRTPIVPRPLGDAFESEDLRPLYGASTIADTGVGSGLALSPVGRSAVSRRGRLAPPGVVVDGDAVRYQTIPDVGLIVPGYFDHSDPNLTSRATLALFDDRYGGAQGFSITPRSATVTSIFANSDGARVANVSFAINGTHSATLESLAGGAFSGSGKALFSVDASVFEGFNFIGFAAQALGTFAVGGVLPGLGGAVANDGFVVAQNPADGVGLGPESLGSFSGVDRQFGQVVTMSQAGVVTKVRLLLDNSGSAVTAPITLDIRRVTGGQIPADDRSVIQSLSLAPSEVPHLDLAAPIFAEFDLGKNAIEVNAGDSLALTLRTLDDTGAYSVMTNGVPDYTGGTLAQRDFETSTIWQNQASLDAVFQVVARR